MQSATRAAGVGTEVDELGRTQVQMSHSGSTTFHNAAAQLEGALQSRPTYSELRDANVVPGATVRSSSSSKNRPTTSSFIAAAAAALHKAQQKDKTHAALRDRPDMGAVLAGGILKRSPVKTAPGLHHRSLQLEKAFLKDSLHQKLRNRPDEAELAAQGILPTAVPASKVGVTATKIAAVAHQLAAQMLKDTTHRKIQTRPTLSETVSAGHLRADPRAVHPALHSKMHQLAKNIVRDSLNRKLKNRPAGKDLLERGLLLAPPEKGGVTLQGPRAQLKKNMMKDKLHHQIQVCIRSLHDWQRFFFGCVPISICRCTTLHACLSSKWLQCGRPFNPNKHALAFTF